MSEICGGKAHWSNSSDIFLFTNCLGNLKEIKMMATAIIKKTFAVGLHSTTFFPFQIILNYNKFD